jgi:ABC-type polysaccharide/polyol phosphate export permease
MTGIGRKEALSGLLRLATYPFGVIAGKLHELVRSRELLLNLTRKEIKVKYKNSILGFLWSMVYPLMMMAIFYFAFGILFQLRGEGMQYFVFYLITGILAWNFFSTALNVSVGSIVVNGALVKKIYFPREVLPLSYIGAAGFNFLLQELVLIAFLLIFRVPLNPWIFALPLVVLLELVFIVGVAFFLSTLNVFLRDVQYFTELLLIAWFWMTPIVYPVTFITSRLPLWAQRIYFLNPMSHIILIYQYIVYNSPVNAPTAVYLSWKSITGVVVGSIVLLFLGYLYFAHQEWKFAEYI